MRIPDLHPLAYEKSRVTHAVLGLTIGWPATGNAQEHIVLSYAECFGPKSRQRKDYYSTRTVSQTVMLKPGAQDMPIRAAKDMIA
jgi:hypothetical protein